MKSIIYTSVASEGTDLNVVMKMITISKQKNKEHGITGMLVFDGKLFDLSTLFHTQNPIG